MPETLIKSIGLFKINGALYRISDIKEGFSKEVWAKGRGFVPEGKLTFAEIFNEGFKISESEAKDLMI